MMLRFWFKIVVLFSLWCIWFLINWFHGDLNLYFVCVCVCRDTINNYINYNILFLYSYLWDNNTFSIDFLFVFFFHFIILIYRHCFGIRFEFVSDWFVRICVSILFSCNKFTIFNSVIYLTGKSILTIVFFLSLNVGASLSTYGFLKFKLCSIVTPF